MKQAIVDTDIRSYVLKHRYTEVDATAKQYLRVFRYFSISAITVCQIIEGLEAERNHSAIAVFQQEIQEMQLFPIEGPLDVDGGGSESRSQSGG